MKDNEMVAMMLLAFMLCTTAILLNGLWIGHLERMEAMKQGQKVEQTK